MVIVEVHVSRTCRSLTGFALTDVRVALATDTWGIIQKEVAWATNGVIRVSYLASGRASREGTALQVAGSGVTQESSLQMRAVVQTTLLPAECPGPASRSTTALAAAKATQSGHSAGHAADSAVAAATGAVTASTTSIACPIIASRTTGDRAGMPAAPACTGSARTTRITAATRVVVQTTGRPDQQTSQRSNQ